MCVCVLAYSGIGAAGTVDAGGGGGATGSVLVGVVGVVDVAVGVLVGVVGVAVGVLVGGVGTSSISSSYRYPLLTTRLCACGIMCKS